MSEAQNQNYVPERAMIVVAHPDDIEFGSAGTAAAWTRAGCEVCYVLCTSGDVGIAEPGMTREQAAEIREKEQRAAAKVAGVNEVVFLREPDGMLENTIDLRRKIVREIRRFKPEVVISGDPTIVWVSDEYINHPDHRAAAGATIEAIFPAAGQPNLFEELGDEGLTAHKVRKVYVRGFGENAVNRVFVDISDVLDLKIAALKEHKSQMGDWDPSERITEWSKKTAEEQDFEYAEAYRVITLVNDEDWEKLKGARW